MAKAPKVVVLDPTSLVGEELVPRLSALAPEVPRQYFHTRNSSDHLIVEVAGEAAVVAPLVDTSELETAGVVVITDNPATEVRERVAAFFTAHPNVPCVDLSRPGVLPGPSVFWPLPGATRVLFPDPALILPAMVLKALVPLAPRRAFFSVVAPVSILGGDAVDELAAQAVARLSGEKPRNRLLPAVAAFDAFPYPEGTFGVLETQLQRMFPDIHITLHPIFAGVFHAHAALATVQTEHPPREGKVRELVAASGFQTHRSRRPLAPSHAAGEEKAIAWVLGTRNDAVSLWTVGDHLLLQAEAACQTIAQLLTSGKA